jgi:type IV pilus assembly protein PilY1
MNIAVRCALAALIIAGSSGVVRAGITLSETPLFLSASVTPNVMLLFDNSGSMDNIMWAPGYDPAEAYRDWSLRCGNNGTSACWSASDGNVFLGEVPRGNCSGGWKQGRRSDGTRKCLKLPAPRGNNTRYNGNYLNYLFETYNTNTDLTAPNTIPQDTRLITAKEVATALIDDNDTLRWGLAHFNPPVSGNSGPGGRVIENCGAPIDDLKMAIDGLDANSNTPLAETFYEITRYFRGMQSYYNSNIDYTSPIRYRCQKNFVIAVTDGFPTYDTTFPNNDEDDVTDTTAALPNWDGLAPTTSQSDYPLFRQHSDGFQPAGSQANEGYSLYFDDLAKFGYDMDLRKAGNDDTGVSFNDPGFRIQRLQTYPVGLAINNQMLRDAAAYSDGKPFTANTSAELREALEGALKEIAAATSAAASIATNSTRLTADSAIYQARFKTGEWSGQLLALPVESNGDIGEQLWDAAEVIPAAANRSIYTYKPDTGQGRRFEWNQLSSAQQAALDRDADGTTDNQGSARLDYLRGDRSNEGSAGLGFRVRSSILGDIVNSDPAFAGQQDYGFTELGGSEGSSYATFRQSSAYRSRPSMIYVGANDGMLHAFRASDGVELFAYVPSLVYDRLSLLSDPDYGQNHKYLVDGPMKTLDAYVGDSWKTVLLGALGAGGRGVFALDVTDPASFGTNQVMWEFSSAQDGDMGYSYPQPTIARTAAGWVAVVANGYNSGNGKAVLFLLDLEDGSVLRKLDTGVAGDNGLSSPIPVDVDGDRITDLVYAGDLKGNLWKFDLRSADPADWRIPFGTAVSPLPLFTACAGTCDGANAQPITARPEVGRNDPSITGTDGYVVYFGTGRYFATGDNSTDGPTNSFYGIYDLDDDAPTSGIDGRSDLLRQEVLATQDLSFDDIAERVRITSNNPMVSGLRGWYLDLPLAGERQVSTPILRRGRIIFTTLIPNTAACAFGGTSYLMELDALTGSRLAQPPFDLNRDGSFDDTDNAIYDGEPVVVGGRQSHEGIIKTPAIIEGPDFEIKLASGTTGGIDTTIEPPSGPETGGRLSWRQMQ